jgi:hydroxymethylbilane synthase
MKALREIKVGSRPSDLAVAQVREFLAHVQVAVGEAALFKHVTEMSAGDKDRKTQLQSVRPGGGAFSSELENAVADGRVRIGVHSLKDLPTKTAPGLVLLAPPPRANPADAVVGSTLAELGAGARVGTSSPRRTAQLLRAVPHVVPKPIRGNVPPRMAKVGAGYEAVILAVAGIERLGRADRIAEVLSLEEFPCSPGQGALGVQVREDDYEVIELLAMSGYACADTYAAVTAERSLLAKLHGGCNVPVGAYAQVDATGNLQLIGQVLSLDGKQTVIDSATGTSDMAEEVGERLAARMLSAGAEEILTRARAALPVPGLAGASLVSA